MPRRERGACGSLPCYARSCAPRRKLGLLVPGLTPEGAGRALSTALELSVHVAFPSPVGSDCLFFIHIPFAGERGQRSVALLPVTLLLCLLR